MSPFERPSLLPLITNDKSKNILERKPITILVAEGRRLVREAWGFILNKDNRFRVIAECENFESAVLQAKNLRPDVVILDIQPPGLSGIEMMPLVRKYSPGSKILSVSTYSFPNIARELMQAGASGYLTKTSSLEEMLEAIIQVRNGEKYICREIRKTIKEQLKGSDDPTIRLSRLSLREIEVIIGVRDGFTSREIALQLKITAKTVEMHRYHILKKLKLNNASELVDFFNKNQTML
jgi:DNA-binding NarL/FixJ family response regulator